MHPYLSLYFCNTEVHFQYLISEAYIHVRSLTVHFNLITWYRFICGFLHAQHLLLLYGSYSPVICDREKTRGKQFDGPYVALYTEGIGSNIRYDFYQRSLVKVADRLHASPPAHICYTHYETMLSIMHVQHSHANYIRGIRCKIRLCNIYP